MVYECDRCGKVLSAGINTCPGCGERFAETVPEDAEVKRGFSAVPEKPKEAGEFRQPLRLAPPPDQAGSGNRAMWVSRTNSTLSAWLDPTPSAARRTVPGAGMRAVVVCAAAAALALIAYIGGWR